MKKVSIHKMNQAIAKWLYGNGKVIKINGNSVKFYHWEDGIGSHDINMDFHSDYNLIMKAFKKAMGGDKKEMTSGELFEAVKKKSKISYSSFYRLIEKMKDAGLLAVEEKNDKGKTRIIRKAKP